MTKTEQCEILTCTDNAILRAEMWEMDDTSTVMALCDDHSHEAGSQYPDCIRLVEYLTVP